MSNPTTSGRITPNSNPIYKNLQKIKVDSLKIRIPVEDVKIVSSTFLEKFQKLYVTGEIAEDISLESHKTDITNGITARIGLVCCRVGKDESKEFIYIQANSKMLKSRYLEGITLDTIYLIYTYIIDLKVIEFDFEQFLNAYVSDIDFAYDVNVSPENMIVMNQKIFSKVHQDKLKYVDKPFRKDSNIGLQFNRREKATPSLPFIKIYHKGIEFEHHSKEFYDSFMKGIDLKNYGRLEYTLKNAKHQKHLGISIKTLRQLLEIDKMMIENIVLRGIPECYVESRIVIRDYGKITPVNKVLIFYMESLIKQGYDKQDLFAVLRLFDGKDSASRRDASRIKNLLNTLFETMENGNKKQAIKNKEINDVLRVLKIDL